MVEGAVLHELAAQVQAGRWEGEREMEGLGLREREGDEFFKRKHLINILYDTSRDRKKKEKEI